MAYKHPNTQTAIEAFAKKHNIEVDSVKARVDKYTTLYQFAKGQHHEERWAANLLNKGSKVVLVNPLQSQQTTTIAEVISVGKSSVKVKTDGREVTFNNDGIERGGLNTFYSLYIVEYIEGLLEIRMAEDKAIKEAEAAADVKAHRVCYKIRSISNNIRSELTADQIDRLAALFDQFDAEDEAAKQQAK